MDVAFRRDPRGLPRQGPAQVIPASEGAHSGSLGFSPSRKSLQAEPVALAPRRYSADIPRATPRWIIAASERPQRDFFGLQRFKGADSLPSRRFPEDTLPRTPQQLSSVPKRPSHGSYGSPQAETPVSRKRRRSCSNDRWPKPRRVQFELDISIKRAVDQFTGSNQGHIQGIFSPKSFFEFTKLWEFYVSKRGDTLPEFTSLPTPDVLPEFKLAYLDFLNLRIIEGTPETPMRHYHIRVQMLRLHDAIQKISELLHQNESLVRRIGRSVSHPATGESKGTNLVRHYLLAVDWQQKSERGICIIDHVKREDSDKFASQMKNAEILRALTAHFGMGVLAMVPKSWKHLTYVNFSL